MNHTVIQRPRLRNIIQYKVMFVALSINIQREDEEKNVEESEVSISSPLSRISCPSSGLITT